MLTKKEMSGMSKTSMYVKTISIFLVLTFISGQVYAGPLNISNNKLAASLVTDPDINPARSKPVQNDIAGKVEPGAIGNGVPLIELARGKLPPKVTLPEEGTAILNEAIGLAIKLSVANQKNVPAIHQQRFKQAIDNLIDLQNKLKARAYLFNADVRSPEDYLIGFNYKENIGLSLELINRLYSISPKRLAQYVFHECVPEKGIITERGDHRVVYNEIQSAIFGKDEVVALKKDLRDFINSGQPQTTRNTQNINYVDISAYQIDENKLSSVVITPEIVSQWDEEVNELKRAFPTREDFMMEAEKQWHAKRMKDLHVYAQEEYGLELVIPEIIDAMKRQCYLYIVKPILSMADNFAESRTMLESAIRLFDKKRVSIGVVRERLDEDEYGNQFGTHFESGTYDARIYDLTRAIVFINSQIAKKTTARNADTIKRGEPFSTVQISENLPVRAKVFAANLTRILADHPDQLFFMGIESDIGGSQKAQIMPIYKAIDEIQDLKDSSGNPLFPNLMVKREGAEKLASMVLDLNKEGKLNLNNAFIGARKVSVDNKAYDTIKGEGRVWISAIDDSKSGDYLPVFEAITLNMMAYLNADVSAIKNFYDAISNKPIDPGVLKDMLKNRVIYILPKATKFDTKQLRELYELAQQVYVAA